MLVLWGIKKRLMYNSTWAGGLNDAGSSQGLAKALPTALFTPRQCRFRHRVNQIGHPVPDRFLLPGTKPVGLDPLYGLGFEECVTTAVGQPPFPCDKAVIANTI